LGYEPNELPDCSTPRQEHPSYPAQQSPVNGQVLDATVYFPPHSREA
jgi:hypothetical protein